MRPARDPGSAAAAPTMLVNTAASIKRFQRFHGLTVDGVVGPQTRSKMRQVNTRLVSPGEVAQALMRRSKSRMT